MADILDLSPKELATVACLKLKRRPLTSFALSLLRHLLSLRSTTFGLAIPASLLSIRSYQRMVYLLKLSLAPAVPTAVPLILSRSGA